MHFKANVYRDQKKGLFTFTIGITLSEHIVLQSTETFREQSDAQDRADWFLMKLNANTLSLGKAKT